MQTVVDMYIDVCLDMCIGMCIDMCTDMCMVIVASCIATTMIPSDERCRALKDSRYRHVRYARLNSM